MCLSVSVAVTAQGTRLLRHPTVSRDLVAFEYAGDLWAVSRSGGQARRLTSSPGVEIDPFFSPDGSKIAFTATVAGNTDVYVMPTAGGDPKRLTYHPGPDRVRGWTPDGRRVLFASLRTSAPLEAYNRLWTIGLEGGLPEPLPLPRAFTGAYSPDGGRLAYEEISTVFFPVWYETSEWRHYRGGRTHPISVVNLADGTVEKLPWTDSNDSYPMWVGNTIYFVSDRNYTANLFAYRVDTRQVTQLTNHDDFDIMTASAGPDAIVYEQSGYIHLVDAKTGQSRRLDIEVTGDLPWARPQFKKVSGMIRNAKLSPGGVRAAFEARGEIFTVPAAKGDYRNLTQSSGAHDRDPAWSPDGSQLAWLSDASGEYQLMLGEPTGLTAPRAIPLPSTAFFSEPTWSPDGSRISIQDNHRNLWIIETASGTAAKIDTEDYPEPSRDFEASWSPDSRWVTYSKNLPSRLRAIFVYSMSEKKAHQVTDGLADSISPTFDAGGKYLYFLSSTDYGSNTGWVEMSSLDRPMRRSIYLAVLSSAEPSPLLPESDDEPLPVPRAETSETPKPQTTPTATPAAKSVRIDLSGIAQRIIAVNVPAGSYANLAAGPAETTFYTETIPGTGTLRLQRYQIKERSAAPFMEGITGRADLGYIIAMMGGELTVGHSYLTGPGDIPGEDPVSVGLLGADVSVENGRYRISRIYTGENWNPDLRAPLSGPGIHVVEGDYILEVNGRPLPATVNFYSLFEGTAGRQTVIRVSKTPSLEGSRLVTVIPVASESGLRTRAWIEGNRRLVDKLSGGRLAYVWLPNTGGPGYTSFTRYFYAQQEKDGAIIDERYNQGGLVADYIVNELDRKPMGYFSLRDGKPFTSPLAGIYGPKVMIINESAGSGGDALPYYFKLRKIGPLVGTKTWGGLVGTVGVPVTIDGGGITAPALAFFNLKGEWDVENIGVAPDIEVENTAAEFNKGHDSQFERSVAEALRLLEQNPVRRLPRPALIDRVTRKRGNKVVSS